MTNKRRMARRHFKDRLFLMLCLTATGLAVITLITLLLSILTQGWSSLSWDFIKGFPSSDPSAAGIRAAIMGTVYTCLICIGTAIPLGVGTAILLEEFKPDTTTFKDLRHISKQVRSRKMPLLVLITGVRNWTLNIFHNLIELNIRNLAGVPSIVYGLLGVTAFASMFGLFGSDPSQTLTIGQRWYDQYTDLQGISYYRKVDGALPNYNPQALPASILSAEKTKKDYDKQPNDAMLQRTWNESWNASHTLLLNTTKFFLECNEIVLADSQNALPQAQQLANKLNGIKASQATADEFNTMRELASLLDLSWQQLDQNRKASPEMALMIPRYLDNDKPDRNFCIPSDIGYQHATLVTPEFIAPETAEPARLAIEQSMSTVEETLRQQIDERNTGRGRKKTTHINSKQAEEIAHKTLSVATFTADVETIRKSLTDSLTKMDGKNSRQVRPLRDKAIQNILGAEYAAQMSGKIMTGTKPIRVSRELWWFISLPFGRGILAGGLTLMLVILPIVIIASQEALRAIPQSVRHGALALGSTRWQAVSHTALPASIPGICTGVILALSRAMGEAAPILMLSGVVYITSTPSNLMDSFTIMPLQIFSWTSQPQDEFKQLAAAGIIVLMVILAGFNALAIFIRHKTSSKH